MAINAFGRYGGRSLSETLLPAISPRVASTLPSSPTIWMVGGRFGISSDWIAGRCAPTQTTTPTTAIPLPRLGGGFRCGGASLSGLEDLRFEAGFFGLSSAIVTRSCGPRRNSDNEA